MRKIFSAYWGLFIIIVALNLSCKKRMATCSHNIYYMNFGFAFVDFSEEDIDTLLLKIYESGTNFNTLVGIDTLITEQFFSLSDTIYRSKTGNPDIDYFFSIGNKADYILELPSISSFVKITDIREGPQSATFQVEGRCSPGAGQARFSSYLAKFESTQGYNIHISHGFTNTPRDNVAYIKK